MGTTANGGCKLRLQDETVANCTAIKAQNNNPDQRFGQFSQFSRNHRHTQASQMLPATTINMSHMLDCFSVNT